MTPEAPLIEPPVCQKCGATKAQHSCGRGAKVWRCRHCHNLYNQKRRTDIKAEAVQAPSCQTCGQLKTAQRSGQTSKGYRWMCMPCFARIQSDAHAHAPCRVVIPERPEPTEPAEEKAETVYEAAFREHMARERRWKLPVANPSKAIRTKNCGG
jgi:ribosomal protein L32